MNEIINFDIDNVDVIEDEIDPQFATFKIDAFACGPNRHGILISEETLRKTAPTILQKPLVWLFDKVRVDAVSHSDLEVPCGFVPHDSPIEFRTLPDGRIMMTVLGKVWKRYSGKLIDIFKRDGKKKSVSVEIEVTDSYKDEKTGFSEILDFIYLCITILGEGVIPAIPLAHAEMVAFANKEKEEYEKALEEFSSKYDDVDFTIPEIIKKNAERGLNLYKKSGQKATSVTLATARFIGKNQNISPEKARHIYKYLNSHINKPKDKNSLDGGYISWLMYGGDQSYEWSKKIVEKLDEIDSKKKSYFGSVVTFPYDSLKDINPALKGINPPITLAQANTIARQADAIGADKGGWGIAISHFKKTHKIEDGRWIEKENMGDVSPKEELSVDDEEKDVKEKEEEMSVEETEKETPEKEEMQAPDEEKQEQEEEKEEEKEEQEEEKEKETEKMSLDSNLDMAALLAMLADETEDYKQLVASHESGTMDYAVLCSAMYKKMCLMAEEMKSKTDAYMSENEELKKFKSDVESERFSYQVEATLNEVSGIMPKEAVSDAREDSKNFSIETIDAWKNKTKALAFTFAKDKKTEDAPKKVGLPFVRTDTAHSSSPWKR